MKSSCNALLNCFRYPKLSDRFMHALPDVAFNRVEQNQLTELFAAHSMICLTFPWDVKEPSWLPPVAYPSLLVVSSPVHSPPVQNVNLQGKETRNNLKT